ncbi:hypothetical protein C8A01DRAFT_19460 [Parachaetomium inaequale]|uniref:BTB domain-containing protein n=1 Tax=Parachaetomium inaequale TaxID=2588326 RepID=A0AAN6PC20_9PEZI|nr:hypothetical protein C8A01DRAFT_19460 [Parachaetomium inaequale]
MPAAILPCTTTTHFSRHSIDNDGDLLLRVGAGHGSEKPVEFKVCSATMRRASPVWKNMLFGPWKEAKPAQGDWVVDLPEDKPSTIETILSIIHGLFASVPKSVSLPVLNDILIYADKYDLIHIVRPWAGTWVEAVKNPKPNSTPAPIPAYYGSPFSPAAPISELSGNDHVMRIQAAWELGCEDVVSAEITDFVLNLSVAGGKTNWSNYYYKFELLEFRSHFGPPDLMEIVQSLRLSLIQTLLDFYHEVVESRTQIRSACIRVSSSAFGRDERPLCDALILGGIWQYLKKAKLESLPVKAEDYPLGANQLMGRLSAMFATLPYLHDSHKDCGPAKKYAAFEKKTKQDERWKNVLRPHHKERMAAQREKTGL